MRTLIIGLGSIGKRHARILKEHFGHELFAFRSKRGGLPNDLGITEVYTWEEVEALKPDVALVTNPTNMHIATAFQCARLGMHLFIEKPLSHSLDGVEKLQRLCREKRLTCYTAYCMRFHPVIKALKERLAGKRILHVRAVVSSYLPYWRSGIDHKESYSANVAGGGGVLLDLSHEFDYCEHLFGTIVDMKGWYGRVSDVTVDAEDVADIFMKTAGGTPMNLYMNFMSQREERRMIVDVEGGYAMGDIRNNRIEWMKDGQKEECTFTTTRDDYLKDQLDYFFVHIGNPAMMNNLEESSTLLRKILELKQNRL